MFEARFCPRCGTPMASQRLGDQERPVCPSCGFVHYVNPIVAAGCLVEEGGRVLLVRRGVEPGLGEWGLPAGYAEVGEGPEQTAIRETREETGVQVALDGLLGTYSFGGETLPGGVVLLYAAHIVAGTPCPGDDATEVRFFSPKALPEDIAFEAHRKALTQWARARAITFRLANSADVATVARMAAEENLTIDRPWHQYVQDPDGALLVAVADQTVVGFASVVHQRAKHAASLNDILVLPPYRRWGIGTRLLSAIADHATRLGAQMLVVEVPVDNPGLALFMHAGFRVCGFLNRTEETVLFLCSDLTASRSCP